MDGLEKIYPAFHFKLFVLILHISIINSMTFYHYKLAKAIKQKRVIELDIDMREAGKQIGVSASTISRIERGGLPDIMTYGLICGWLKKDLKHFLH